LQSLPFQRSAPRRRVGCVTVRPVPARGLLPPGPAAPGPLQQRREWQRAGNISKLEQPSFSGPDGPQPQPPHPSSHCLAHSTCPQHVVPEGRAKSVGYDDVDAAAVRQGAPCRRAGCVAVCPAPTRGLSTPWPAAAPAPGPSPQWQRAPAPVVWALYRPGHVCSIYISLARGCGTGARRRSAPARLRKAWLDQVATMRATRPALNHRPSHRAHHTAGPAASPCAPHLPGGCRSPVQQRRRLLPQWHQLLSFAAPAPDMGAGGAYPETPPEIFLFPSLNHCGQQLLYSAKLLPQMKRFSLL
jgi:hypothetical protein